MGRGKLCHPPSWVFLKARKEDLLQVAERLNLLTLFIHLLRIFRYVNCVSMATANLMEVWSKRNSITLPRYFTPYPKPCCHWAPSIRPKISLWNFGYSIWRMEQNFPVIPIFRNIGTSSRGTPKIPKWDSGKCPSHSLLTRNFRNFWSNGKHPFRCLSTYPIFRSVASL